MAHTILVVDDEAHIRRVVSMKLERAGYEVITAGDGEEALDVCRQSPPDLIITDYQMPVMTGLEFCQGRRQCAGAEHIPAIMLTARGFDVSTEELEDAGVVSVMDKPFSPREIVMVVEDILAGCKAGEGVGVAGEVEGSREAM